MSKLKLCQQQFCEALFEEGRDTSFVTSQNAPARLAIYRQTVIENLSNTLALIYPGIWALIGEQCANEVAHAFIKKKMYLPKPGELDNWVSAFPSFISTVIELQNYPYLSDYAQWEWLKHHAYGYAYKQGLSLDALESIAEPALASLKMAFMPFVEFLQTPYPLQDIQMLLDNPNSESLNLKPDDYYLVVTRVEEEIKTLWLEKTIWLCLKYLSEGKTLGETVSALTADYPDFDLASSLITLFNQNLVSHFD